MGVYSGRPALRPSGCALRIQNRSWRFCRPPFDEPHFLLVQKNEAQKRAPDNLPGKKRRGPALLATDGVRETRG